MDELTRSPRRFAPRDDTGIIAFVLMRLTEKDAKQVFTFWTYIYGTLLRLNRKREGADSTTLFFFSETGQKSEGITPILPS